MNGGEQNSQVAFMATLYNKCLHALLEGDVNTCIRLLDGKWSVEDRLSETQVQNPNSLEAALIAVASTPDLEGAVHALSAPIVSLRECQLYLVKAILAVERLDATKFVSALSLALERMCASLSPTSVDIERIYDLAIAFQSETFHKTRLAALICKGYMSVADWDKARFWIDTIHEVEPGPIRDSIDSMRERVYEMSGRNKQ